MRQEITRNHKGWSLDNVVLANDVMKMATKEEVTSAPSEGVYIYGLKVDGAAWRMSREKVVILLILLQNNSTQTYQSYT